MVRNHHPLPLHRRNCGGLRTGFQAAAGGRHRRAAAPAVHGRFPRPLSTPARRTGAPGAALGSALAAATTGGSLPARAGACLMRAAHEDPDLRYLLHTPAGAQYVSQITAQESDRRTRAAFRDLVLKLAPPGA